MQARNITATICMSVLVLVSVYLFIQLVTHVTVDMSITVYNLHITTQLIIYGYPPNIIK
jgi:hypothetical protein